MWRWQRTAWPGKSWNRWGCIVNAYLDLAEESPRRKIPMTMEDWAKRLDAFLAFSDYDILEGAGKVSAEVAKSHALRDAAACTELALR